MKIVILDWQTMTCHNNDISPDCLKKYGDLQCHSLTSSNSVAETIGDAEILLCNKTKITKDIVEKCPNLKYIGLFATGFNNIDLEATANNNITVCNAGTYATMAVAQHTFALILSHYSKISEFNSSVKNGDWQKSETFSYFPIATHELEGKTLAIIGYGSIGKAVAKIGDAFGMRVIVHPHRPLTDCPYQTCSLDETLQQADILTLHCPLTKETEHLINANSLSKMKNSAIIVNTARGDVVNENDLANALNNHSIAGAYLDVLSAEPMSENTPLKNAQNCTITPHSAWAALETRTRLLNIVDKNIQAFLNGNPINKVN